MASKDPESGDAEEAAIKAQAAAKAAAKAAKVDLALESIKASVSATLARRRRASLVRVAA